MFTEAWRLERDYFYDRGMHGLDWPAIKAKYQPLVDRVTDRDELSDVLAQMVSELSALHIFVRGGDRAGRAGPRDAGLARRPAGQRDEAAGGYRVDHIYRTDPDRPDRLVAAASSPAWTCRRATSSRWSTACQPLSVPDVGMLLRNQADKQVLLRVKPKAGGAARDDDRRADDGVARERPALRRVGVHAAPGRREGGRRQDRLRPPARDGRRQHGASGIATSTRSSTATG